MSRRTEAIRSSPMMWDLFTQWPEYSHDAAMDAHGRFVNHRPQGDGDLRAEVSRFLKERRLEPEYPDGKGFSVVLTHDVDLIRPSMTRGAISAVRCVVKGRLKEAREHLGGRSSEASPYRQFSRIMDLEEKYGGRSTFFFMTSGPDQTGAGYRLDEVSGDITSIHDRGWEIGLHGGYDSYLSSDGVGEEKAALEAVVGRPIEGYRNHYLRFKTPDTWHAVERAGFQYDSTAGHADRWGFRNGTASPYRPIDRSSGEEMDLIELPLALMDTTLFGYAGLSPKQSWQIASRLLEEVKEVSGTLVVLWHNDTFGNPALDAYSQVYEKILRAASADGGWLCSAGEAASWWRTHDR